jgi:carbonic anhydrase
MGKRTKVALTLAGLMLMGSNAFAITVENQLTFDELMTGNDRFVAGLSLDNLAVKSLPAQRATTALAQTPKVIVLDCSDSRLTPEILFDKGLGELFVVRVAGNVIAPHQIASIEYAIEHLGAKMVVVLGHERCGGVTAAYNAFDAAGVSNTTPAPTGPYLGLTPALQNLVTTMMPAVAVTKGGTYTYPPTPPAVAPATGPTITSVTTSGTVTDCILNNTHITMNDLKAQSDVIKGILALLPGAVGYDELLLVEAFYDLEDGKVTVTRATGAVPVTTIATTPETAIHTVTSSATAGGTIAPSGASAAVNGGSQTFKVIPAAGFKIGPFATGAGACAAGTLSGNDYTVGNVTANCTVTASFVAGPPPVSAPVSPSGTNAAATLPNYIFTPAAAATHYITYLYDTTTRTGAFSAWTLATTACTVVGVTPNCQIPQATALTAGHTYNWYVLSYNAVSAAYSPWSTYMTFRQQ